MPHIHDGPVMDVPPDTPIHRLVEPELVDVMPRLPRLCRQSLMPPP